jgi:hypothetical protein
MIVMLDVERCASLKVLRRNPTTFHPIKFRNGLEGFQKVPALCLKN